MRFRTLAVLIVLLQALPTVAGANDTPTIDTVAGGIPDGQPATEVSLKPVGLDYDADGNLYIADPGNGMVWKRTPDGLLHHVAGSGITCIPDPAKCAEQGGDQAATAFFRSIAGLAIGPDGGIYVSENRGNTVKRIDLEAGNITTVAGTGEQGYDPADEGGPATDAELWGPGSLDFDSRGNLYIADVWNRRIREVTPAGTITTIAGCGSQEFPGCFTWAQDGSPVETTPIGVNSGINGNGWGIAVSPSDELYIADVAQILKLDQAQNSYRVILGKAFEYADFPGQGEGGPASDARVQVVVEMAFAANGDLYFMEGGGSFSDPWSRVQKIDAPATPASIVRHVGGLGTGAGFSGDGASAKQARFSFSQPTGTWTGQGIAVSPSGVVAVSDVRNERVRGIDAQGKVATIAGNGYSGPAGVARTFNLMYSATMTEGLTPRGGFSGDGKDATIAQLNFPVDVEVDRFGNRYVLEYGNRRVRKIAPNGTITTVAGGGCAGEDCDPYLLAGGAGDGGLATKADFYQPMSIALDRTGTQLYIADAGQGRIRQVNMGSSTFVAFPLSDRPVEIKPDQIQTILGTGSVSADAPASQFNLSTPTGVTTDGGGAIYVSDESANIVVRAEPSTGLVTVVAGVPLSSDCNGTSSDGPGRATLLCGPGDLAVAGGSLYITETGYEALVNPEDPLGFPVASRIRKVDLTQPTNPTTTVAGTGALGWDGDGGAATAAMLAVPHGVAIGPDGSIYIGDSGNHRVRRIAPNGTITTVAGSGSYSDQYSHEGCAFSGDGGAAADASFCNPMGLDFGPDGTLYVADAANNRIRAISGL